MKCSSKLRFKVEKSIKKSLQSKQKDNVIIADIKNTLLITKFAIVDQKTSGKKPVPKVIFSNINHIKSKCY